MITLPWSVLLHENHRLMPVRIKGKTRNILSPEYRQALAAASQLAAFQWTAPALKTSVGITVRLYEPDKRRRDVSNYLKLIQDALARIAFVDDSQIDDVHVMRGGLDRAKPRAEIEVREL